MNITQAITQENNTPLSVLTFKAVKMYGGDKKTGNGDFIYKVMVDTPQGTPNVYVTFFTPTRPQIVDGQEYEIKAQVTPQGAKGIKVSHYNGNAGITVNKEATIAPLGAAAHTQTQPPTQQVQAPQPAYAPPVEDPAFVHPTVQPQAQVGTGGSSEVKLTRAELLGEMKKIFTEAIQISHDLTPEQQVAFAKQAVASVPAYWFGDKMSY